MKKKILGVALIAAMAVAAGWNFNQSKNEAELTDLVLANVEALAQNENAASCIPNCTFSPISDCLGFSSGGGLNKVCYYFRVRF